MVGRKTAHVKCKIFPIYELRNELRATGASLAYDSDIDLHPFDFQIAKITKLIELSFVHMVMPRACICKFECNRFYAKIVFYHAVLHLRVNRINRVKRLLNESLRYLSRKQAQQTISSIHCRLSLSSF